LLDGPARGLNQGIKVEGRRWLRKCHAERLQSNQFIELRIDELAISKEEHSGAFAVFN
jgi:hypothetical protein